LADRALEHVLRTKRHLYSNERRAVAERVYALLRRQRTVDALLERAGAHLEQRPPTQQDLLRLSASRVLHGETPERVARTSGLRPPRAPPPRAPPPPAPPPGGPPPPPAPPPPRPLRPRRLPSRLPRPPLPPPIGRPRRPRGRCHERAGTAYRPRQSPQDHPRR